MIEERITQVTVRRLKTTEGYNNVAVEATVPIIAGVDDPAQVRADLDLWVQGQLDGKSVAQLREEGEMARANIDNWRQVKTHLEDEVTKLNARVSKLKDALKGVDDDELPF